MLLRFRGRLLELYLNKQTMNKRPLYVNSMTFGVLFVITTIAGESDILRIGLLICYAIFLTGYFICGAIENNKPNQP